MHRLFLAFALEVIHFMQTCDLRKIGSLDPVSCPQLNQLIQRMVPWYNDPGDTTDMYGIERSLLDAVNSIPKDISAVSELNPRQAFEDLTRITQSWCDIARDKRLLFLLDDVSVRYMSKESVETILRQLCFQSGLFSFKLSTETQTLALKAPGEKLAQIGRDYDVFDLGDEVFAILRDTKERVPFIKTVLTKRAENTDGLPEYQRVDPEMLLGRRTLKSLALDICGKSRGQVKSSKSFYSGLSALVGICVGDLGEIITIYERMLRHANAASGRVDDKHQHKELMDFSEARLRALAVRDPWLYAHAIAFAQASHRELVASPENRLRQYGEVDVTIGIEEADALFPKIIQLIDAGVFVVTGATSRMKNRRPSLQFRLAYRKLLGLTHRIPLSMRDRFELSNRSLRNWIENPKSSELVYKQLEEQQIDEEEEAEVLFESGQRTLFDNFGEYEVGGADRVAESRRESSMELLPRVLYDVRSDQLTGFKATQALQDSCLVGAFGFEDRSVGSWQNVIDIGTPSSALLLRYRDPEGINAENERRLQKLVHEVGIKSDTIDTKAIAESGFCEKLYSRIPESSKIAIDTTSLTKPLIFELISGALRSRNQVHVLHTCADEYFPTDEELQPIAKTLSRNLDDSESPSALKETFDRLDEMVTGEAGPYRCVRIEAASADPSQPVFLAALVALKLEPIRVILEQGEVERSAIIYPEHSAGKRALRSVVAKHLSDFLSQLHNGEGIILGSLDHVAAFSTLVELHRRWTLKYSFNFELALTGTKMHTVGAAMFASTVVPAGVYYAQATRFDPATFTKGTEETLLVSLRRTEKRE
jgi:hypothetical protein